MKQKNTHHVASATPLEDIQLVSYKGQDPQRKMYHSGFEQYLNQMPVLNPNDEFLQTNIDTSRLVMEKLAKELNNYDWPFKNYPCPGGFNRTIIAIESPLTECAGFHNSRYVVKENSEIVVAKWGDGFQSPVHGHAVGYLHEQLIRGKMLIHTYRLMSDNRVRVIRSDIYNSGDTLAAIYTSPDAPTTFRRQTLIHSFKSIGESVSLHYLPEHTRDGRDNQFHVERFETFYDLKSDDMKRISGKDGMYLRKGSVCLVRSTNVPEYGDHFIVVTGAPEMKEHGLRVKDVALESIASGILDEYGHENGLTLLQLDKEAEKAFHEFHGITMENGEVVFPNA